MSIRADGQSPFGGELPGCWKRFAAQNFDEVIELRGRAELEIEAIDLHMKNDIAFVRNRCRGGRNAQSAPGHGDVYPERQGRHAPVLFECEVI